MSVLIVMTSPREYLFEINVEDTCAFTSNQSETHTEPEKTQSWSYKRECTHMCRKTELRIWGANYSPAGLVNFEIIYCCAVTKTPPVSTEVLKSARLIETHTNRLDLVKGLLTKYL